MDLRSAISFSDLVMTIPFENSIDVFDIRGDHLKEIFEHAVARESEPQMFLGFLQVSGRIKNASVSKLIIQPNILL